MMRQAKTDSKEKLAKGIKSATIFIYIDFKSKKTAIEN